MKTCVIPTPLYGAKNWILDGACLELMNVFKLKVVKEVSISDLHTIHAYSHPNWLVLRRCSYSTSAPAQKLYTFFSRMILIHNLCSSQKNFSLLLFYLLHLRHTAQTRIQSQEYRESAATEITITRTVSSSLQIPLAFFVLFLPPPLPSLS